MRTLMPRVAPSALLAAAAAVALLLVAAVYLVATRQPWLGIDFKPDRAAGGLAVVKIDARSPNRQLKPGDVVTGLASGQQEVRFDAKLLPIGEVDVPNFATFNRYAAQHDALWQTLTSGDFTFVLLDGRRIGGRAAPARPTTDLPWRFWALPTVGLAAFLIGIAIAVYRPKLSATPVIVVGGAGMFVAAVLAGLFVSRELTLSPPWLRLGMEEFNPGSEVVVFSLAALLWYYPRPLYRLPVALLCALVVALVWMNEWFQLRDLPPHTYMPQYLVAYLAMVVFAIMQWRQTREDALSRAALQWFLLVNIVVTGLFNMMSVVPIAYGQPSIIGKADTFFLGPLIYFGLAFGVARYRLFDIERWWLEVWLWLGGGLLVIGIDVLLITLFQLADLLALGFALILAGWVYLPIRQWLFRRMMRPSLTRLDDHFPLLIETLFHDGPGRTFGERWRHLLQRVFAPAALTVRAAPAVQAELMESGLSLHVPSFEGNETHELRFREQGRRLYTPRDVALADLLLSLTRRAARLWQEREEGARTERGRIMRDLHDDVAARLLSLMHRARDPALYQQAHEALSALRQTIYALDDSRPITLSDLMTELQAQVRERLRDTGVALDWLDPPAPPEVNLSARQRINLTRVMQEALANALRHAAPAAIRVRWDLKDGRLSLRFCNDGTILRMEDWQTGKGTANIRARMTELGGEAQWNVTSQHAKPLCCLQIALPLP